MPDYSDVSVFIAAPAQSRLEVLKRELRSRGLHVFTAYDLKPATHSLADHIKRAIKKADLIVGVVPETASPNVFFELGVAHALQKPFLLLISPKCGNIPSDLAGMLYVRADPDNVEAIRFAFDQCLSRLKTKPPRRVRTPREGQPLGTKADRYIAQLKRSAGTIRGAELESLVSEILRAAGVKVIAQSTSRDEGVDIAVWADDLQPISGNPLIVQVKTAIRSKQQLLEAVNHVDRLRDGRGTDLHSCWSIVRSPHFLPCHLSEVFSP